MKMSRSLNEIDKDIDEMEKFIDKARSHFEGKTMDPNWDPFLSFLRNLKHSINIYRNLRSNDDV